MHLFNVYMSAPRPQCVHCGLLVARGSTLTCPILACVELSSPSRLASVMQRLPGSLVEVTSRSVQAYSSDSARLHWPRHALIAEINLTSPSIRC